MNKSFCGIDCSECRMKADCQGCRNSCGKPFGKECFVAHLCKNGAGNYIEYKQKVIDAFNSLGIDDMDKVTDMNPLKGEYINLNFLLPGAQKVRFWDDCKIYLGNQMNKKNTDRCYGLAADDKYLLVCEYGENGTDPEIVIFKRRNR